MKKFISLLLALSFIIYCIPSLSLDVTAEDKYADLLKEKRKYEDDYLDYERIEREYNSKWELYHKEFDFAFLMYTKKGQELTYLIEDANSESLQGHMIYHCGGNKVITCLELAEIHESTVTRDGAEILGKTSTFRKVIQELGLTKNEIIDAYEMMRESPETAAGSLLPTEAEAYLIELRWPEPIPNYMLEAAFIKDDDIAEFLLSNMYGVYIKELGYTVLFTKLVDSSGLDLDVISEFDLTTYSFMQFTNYMDRYGSSQYFDFYLPLNDKAKARVDKFYEIKILQDKQLRKIEKNNSTYKNLWNEKMEYEESSFSNGLRFSVGSESFGPYIYGDYAGEGGSAWGYGFDFILFTKQGKKLSYIFCDEDNAYKLFDFDYSLFWSYGPLGVGYYCEEFWDIYAGELNGIDDATGLPRRESSYRNVVQALGISASELKEAYRRMKEEPEYARDVFPELTDEQFEAYAKYLKTLDVPPNFVIQAACMKNNEKAETLLNMPGMVYVKELGYSIWFGDIFMYSEISAEELIEFDLTTDSFSTLLKDMKDYFEKGNGYVMDVGMIDDKGRNAEQVLDVLLSEYDRQIKENPKTGENWYFIPAAAVSLVAGIFVICPRRKKFD